MSSFYSAWLKFNNFWSLVFVSQPFAMRTVDSHGVPDRNTALVTIALLILENVVTTAEQGLWYYSDRVAPPKSGLNSSQRRLLAQLQEYVKGAQDVDTGYRLRLKNISARGMPGFSRDRRSVKPYFEVSVNGRKEFTTFQGYESTVEYAAGGTAQASLGGVNVQPCQVQEI